MGVSIGVSRCSTGDCSSNNNSNPNPYNFKLLRHSQIRKHLVVELLYPDCNNYEGRKILVFKNLRIFEFEKLTCVDPHFCNNHLSPFARFEPTDAGWEAAKTIANLV